VLENSCCVSVRFAELLGMYADLSEECCILINQISARMHIFLVKFWIACNAALAAALVHKISPSPAFCAPRAVGKISCKTLQLTRAKKMEEDEYV